MNSDRLLVVDDDPDLCDFIKDVAEGLGYQVISSSTAAGVFSGLRTFAPNVLFLDLRMPEIDGVEVIRRLGEQHCGAQIVLASGEDPRVLNSARQLAESHGLRVATTLQKPIPLDRLEAILNKLRASAPPITDCDLVRGMAAGELMVHYQPKVVMGENHDWRVDSVEALVRWNHPHLGLLAPDMFVPLAEQSELIWDMTEHVLACVLANIKDWRLNGTVVPVAVNLSPRLLDDLEVPDRLASQVATSGVAGSDVIFEITETSAMADVGRAMDVLTRLRLKGFKLSVDDFGTGFSSLIHLYRMPFSELKIDKEFVCGLPGDQESATIVKALINLGHDLGLQVCVEGVETQGALAHLQACHSDLYQGYHFSPPLPGYDFQQLISGQFVKQPCADAGASPDKVP